MQLAGLVIDWHPGIGDPTVAGWVTVGLYFFAALGALAVLRVATGEFPSTPRRQRGLWWVLLVCLILLGINKQLDLQTLFTELGRALSREQGWYGQRRVVQRLFIDGVVVTSIIVTLALFYYYRGLLGRNILALSGFVFVVGYVLIRATSYHNTDHFIHTKLGGLEMNWILECFGLLLIIINEWLLLRRAKAAQMVSA
ncbi:hypothetical protein [Halioxenophilus sp. WMMB6]|uniref:hypothetical protein n=1 Tax=Halioxenophilus sp. WMMB6 TaxID=3073815 RepID=UPI00295ECEA9|nr:hypothetical protein [Halioxenophilus sp. WMMB6]